MRQIYKYSLLLLSALTGFVFLYSAYIKLIPIQAFEYTLVADANFPRIPAAIAARFFIGLESVLGLLIIIHFWGNRKWVLKVAFALLSIFSVYLIYLWIAKGNNVNCGCFGDSIFMKPATSLVKNAFILFLLFVLFRYQHGFYKKWINTTIPFIITTVIVVIFIIYPILKPYKFNFTSMYSGDDIPKTDLRKGKHIIAFLNPSCIHCRRTALKMHTDLMADSTLPFFMVIGGLKSDLRDFWQASQAQNIPYMRLESGPFIKYTHNITPYIIWINNGIVEEETNYDDLSTPAIEKWLQY